MNGGCDFIPHSNLSQLFYAQFVSTFSILGWKLFLNNGSESGTSM